MADGLFAVGHDPGCARLWPVPDHWKVEAKFSERRTYRFLLTHRWDDRPLVLFLLMNPSGADERFLDATTKKTAGMAMGWEYGGQVIANVSPYRRTDSTRLKEYQHLPGILEYNYEVIHEAASSVERVVIAHGHMPTRILQHWAETIVHGLAIIHPLYVLGLAPRSGEPMHPLARGRNQISLDVRPQLWRP